MDGPVSTKLRSTILTIKFMNKQPFALLGLCLLGTGQTQAQSSAASPADTAVVWTEATGGNGHMYELTLVRDTWTNSELAAQARGGHLVSINSQAEQDFLISTFLADGMPTATVPLWIGLTDQPFHDSQSYNTWTTGEPVTFKNFNPGDPNNQQADEDYVAMNWHYSFGSSATKGTWNDLSNGGSTVSFNDINARALGPYYGVIETVPEPGTYAMLACGAVAGLWMARRKRSGAAPAR